MKDFRDWWWSYAVTSEGLHLWQIQGESINYVSSYTDFLYEDDVYLMLQTIQLDDGKFEYHQHIWVGAGASEQHLAHATRLAAGLDVFSCRRSTLHWERRDRECELFVSYFRPALMYLPGKCSLTFMKDPEEPKESLLFSVYLHRNMKKMKPVKCDMSSLNKRDPLILVTDAVYILPLGSWKHDVLLEIGNMLAKRLMFKEPISQDILMAVMLDQNAGIEDWDNFYKALGWEDPDSFPAIPDGPQQPETENHNAPKLYEILRNRRGHIYYRDLPFPFYRNSLDSKSLYILANGKDNVCLWIGKKNQDRNKAKLYGIAKLREFATRQIPLSKWPPWNHMAIIPEGLEPISFKRQFYDWFGLD